MTEAISFTWIRPSTATTCFSDRLEWTYKLADRTKCAPLLNEPSQLNTCDYEFSRPPSWHVFVGFETLESVAKQWYEGLKILILLFQWICEWASSACYLNLTAPSICKRLAPTKSAHDGFRASWWFLTMGSPQVQHEKFLPRLGYWSLFYGHISSDPQATTNLSPTSHNNVRVMVPRKWNNFRFSR